MISTVVFDIGQVLVGYDPLGYLRRLFPGDDETVRAVSRAVWDSGLWTELDGGADTAETLERMCALAPGREDAVRRAFRGVRDCVWRMDYAKPWIRELKARMLRVLYLSNYSDHMAASAPEVLDFIPLTDGGVFSWRVKQLKPDPAIYRTLCENYALSPAECVFIDDNPDNIRAARDFGLIAILFEGYEDAREKLEQYLN